MIYKNLMGLPKICTPRTLFSNCVLHVVNKYILSSVQWMHYTTDSTNTKNLDTKESNNNQNLPIRSLTQNFDAEVEDIASKDSSPSRKNTDLYLTNPEVAKKFVTLIKDDLLKNMYHVVEANPGFGYLTEELFKIGVPFIHLFENSSEYWIHLNNLCTKFPNQLSITKLNLFNISKMLTGVSVHSDIIYKLINNVQQRKWEEESCMQVIGTTSKSVFIRHLILSTIFQTGLTMFGRPIFYLAIPSSTCDKFTCIERSTTLYIMFNILFNYEIYGTVDRKAFIPQYKSKEAKRKRVTKDDSSVLNVIKIEPKPDLFTLFKTKKNLIYFWHFVRYSFYKPNTRVIPTLENLVPGCGIKLIALNYNIFTEFGDLNPRQIYDLFVEFQSWPEYEQCSFQLSAGDIRRTYQLYLEEEDV
ncbi:dimethyladenosine transferase 2, mitochondrial [Osmia bicornis bicornis]|uniref:dimethyladenosine transferase 2, mitochondrial n=1 Tax=Osmia bicornis bicornis TaxID=1437191 RepID=UPI0010F9ECE3|nr:dimethyladenosine transferase 2, mitochondrial [Osmia bicornis bicornis]XP_029036573.1 dimethyladenosine transferase 2, mitochondrial [Osmia bicornis bicornis]